MLNFFYELIKMKKITLEIDEYNNYADIQTKTIFISSSQMLKNSEISDLSNTIIHETLHIVISTISRKANNLIKRDIFSQEFIVDELTKEFLTCKYYRSNNE